jgi:hypothetical protein
MNGKVVGVIANNPMIYSGAMDVSRPQANPLHRAVRLLPHSAGVLRRRARLHGGQQDAEEAATLSVRAVYVGLQASVPMFTVVCASAAAWPAWARPTRVASTSGCLAVRRVRTLPIGRRHAAFRRGSAAPDLTRERESRLSCARRLAVQDS